MNKFILIILLFSFTVLTFAQNENADAEFLSITKEYTLNEDGSIDYHYNKELKLLSHYAFHRLYGETFIIFNTDFQTLKINEAYTIMADGKKVVTPDNAFNEVLPRFSNNAPSYNHIREMVVTHTGLEVGTVIHLDYTIHSNQGFYPELMVDEILEESSPVKQLVIKINVPDSKNLSFKLLDTAKEPDVVSEKGNTSYTWTFENLPAGSKDNYQVKGNLDVPRLLASSFTDFSAAFNQFINQKGFNFETEDCMKACIENTPGNNQDQLSVVLALQKIVSNDLNNLHVPLKYTGFNFRSPKETWKSNQGTIIEKTILLVALLKKANIEASPVVIIPDQMYDEGQGNLNSFNEFAVLVEPEGFGQMLISAGRIDKQSPGYNMQGKTALLLDKELTKPVVVDTPEKSNKIDISGILNFNTDGLITGNVNVVLNGNANPYFAIYKNGESVKSILKGGIGSKDISSFKTVQLSQDVCRTYFEVEKQKPLQSLNGYLSFIIPFAEMGVDSWHMNLLPAQRNVAMEVGEIHEKYEYKLTYEDGLKPVFNPSNIKISNDVGFVNIQFEDSDGQLTIKREIKLNKKIIEPLDYIAFKAIMDAWNTEVYKKVIFKK